MRIGSHRVVRRLGHGGMAEVFLARSVGASGFEKPVAIKRLREELRGEGELERLLIEEAKQGARLRHRNLVSVHDLGVDDGYYVVMEWIDGADLAQLGVAPPRLALAIAAEIAEALAYIHSLRDERGRPLGLVHRDVSPSNVLVSRNGEVKLSDFGIAKATKLAETTQASIRRGKYAYMSPEQVRSEPLEFQSDQFGFGILLHELLTGSRPFDGGSPVETMDRIREAVPPDVSNLDADLGAIILRCVAASPVDRFDSAEELARALIAARWQRKPTTVHELATWVCDALDGPDTRPRPPTRPLGDTRPLSE